MQLRVLVGEGDLPPSAVHTETVLGDHIQCIPPRGAISEQINRDRAHRLQLYKACLHRDARLLTGFAPGRFERCLATLPAAGDTLPAGIISPTQNPEL